MSLQLKHRPLSFSHSSARPLQLHGRQLGKFQYPLWHWSHWRPYTPGRHRHWPAVGSQKLSRDPMSLHRHAENTIFNYYLLLLNRSCCGIKVQFYIHTYTHIHYIHTLHTYIHYIHTYIHTYICQYTQIYTFSGQTWHEMARWRSLKHKGYITSYQKILLVNTLDVREFKPSWTILPINPITF